MGTEIKNIGFLRNSRCLGKANPEQRSPPLNGTGTIFVATYFVANTRALGLTHAKLDFNRCNQAKTCDRRQLTVYLACILILSDKK